MRSLREFEAMLVPISPDEAVQLLSADKRYMDEAFPGLRDLDVDQSERRALS
jgi:hypothetical protein